MNINLTLPAAYTKQREAIWASERISIIEASTKSGKTVGCMLWMLDEVIRNGREGRNFWWIAPVYPQAEIAFRRIRHMLREADSEQVIWSSNESKLTITIRSKGTVWFKSAEKPDNLYGEDVYAAVIDEASRMREESWYAVRSTLTATRGPIRIIGNVKGRKNWAYLLGVRAKGGDPGLSYHRITAYDAVEAGVLDIAEIEDAKRTLPPHVFAELYLAEPADDGGNPFDLRAIADCTTDTLARGEPKWFGVDLAKSHDWTVVVGMNDHGEVCSFERWQAPWSETEARVLNLVGFNHALVDSTGVGDPIVERMARTAPLVSGYLFSQQSKQRLMEGLAMAIQQRRVRFPAGPIADELEQFEYQYKAGGRVSYSAPEGMHDDCVCALALAVQCMGAAKQFTVDIVDPNPDRKHGDSEPVGSYMSRMRQDPDWGFNGND